MLELPEKGTYIDITIARQKGEFFAMVTESLTPIGQITQNVSQKTK